MSCGIPQIDEIQYMKCALKTNDNVQELRYRVFKVDDMIIKSLDNTTNEEFTCKLTESASKLILGAEYIGHEKHETRIYLKTKLHEPFKLERGERIVDRRDATKRVSKTFGKIYDLAVKISESPLKFHPDFHEDNIVIRNYNNENRLVMIDWDGNMYGMKRPTDNVEAVKMMLQRYVGYEFIHKDDV